MNKRQKALEQINQELIEAKKSPLYKYRTDNGYVPVPGEGSVNANVFLIGEAPGKNEAITGKPFNGAAGKILTSLFESIGHSRDEVFIGSLLKDRPPKNRNPLPKEIKFYGTFLDRQIEIIKPKVLVALGKFAMEYLFEKYNLADQIAPISQIHGKKFEAKASYGKVIIVPLYHPAAAIYNQSLKDVLKKDFKILKKYV